MDRCRPLWQISWPLLHKQQSDWIYDGHANRRASLEAGIAHECFLVSEECQQTDRYSIRSNMDQNLLNLNVASSDPIEKAAPSISGYRPATQSRWVF